MTLRTAALWFGGVNLGMGLLGFFGPLVVGADGLINIHGGRLLGVLTMNWAHAGVHVTFGLYGLAARRSEASSAQYLRATAWIFGLVAALGVLGHLGLLVARGAEGDLVVLEIALDVLGTAIHLLWAGAAVAFMIHAARTGDAPQSHPAAPVILGSISGGIIAIILLLVLIENVQVAPWAGHGEEGRLHFQTKNVTRLAGDAEAVRAAVSHALGANPDARPLPPGDWREQVRAATGWAPAPRHVVALPSEGDEAMLWSLPGAYWAAFSGAPVVFVGRESVDAEAEAAVTAHGLPVYVLAGPDVVGEEVLERLAGLAPVERVAAGDLAGHAVRVAGYRDRATGFGWGRDRDALPTWFHFVMAAPEDAEAAYAALPLGRTVAAPFLFADDDGGVPAVTDRYWWSLRADWAVTPSETSFRHLWILGDRVSYGAQGRMDVAVEKAAYISKGSIAMSGLEGVGVVLISLGLAGFVFVLLHGMRLLPEVMPTMRIAWAFTALLLPVAGVILYLAAYRRPRLDSGDSMARWLRPPAIQAATATAMGFGYGAPLMIVVGWAFAFYGFPLFFGPWADGALFLLGAGMPLMMLAMYVGAVLIAWPSVQLGMQAMMLGASRRAVMWRALGVTALSMAAVSLGMMATSWFMMMERDPMMMPHEDEILWIFSLWLASSIGFLVAWPLNWPMVRGRLKSGTM